MSLTEWNTTAKNERDNENGDSRVEVISFLKSEEVNGEAAENGANRAQCIAQQVQEHGAQVLRGLLFTLHFWTAIGAGVFVLVVWTTSDTSRFGGTFFECLIQIRDLILVFVFVFMLVLVFVSVSVSVRVPVAMSVMVMQARVTNEHEQTDQIHSESA